MPRSLLIMSRCTPRQGSSSLSTLRPCALPHLVHCLTSKKRPVRAFCSVFVVRRGSVPVRSLPASSLGGVPCVVLPVFFFCFSVGLVVVSRLAVRRRLGRRCFRGVRLLAWRCCRGGSPGFVRLVVVGFRRAPSAPVRSVSSSGGCRFAAWLSVLSVAVVVAVLPCVPLVVAALGLCACLGCSRLASVGRLRCRPSCRRPSSLRCSAVRVGLCSVRSSPWRLGSVVFAACRRRDNGTNHMKGDIKMTNKNYFEMNGRVYMPYTYWRRHIAPWRSKRPHKNYYPTLKDFRDYFYLAAQDGYMPYGFYSFEDKSILWLQVLSGLREQIGLKPLTLHEERESLDKGEMVCYT